MDSSLTLCLSLALTHSLPPRHSVPAACLVGKRKTQKIRHLSQSKVQQYLFLKATEDVETQRKGVVLVFWGFGPNGDLEFPIPDKREHLGE
jgi:hypothetical protein